MRFLLAGAVIAAAVYLCVEALLLAPEGEAKPDFSVPAILLLGALIAALMAAVLGIAHLIGHRAGHHSDRSRPV